MEFKLPSWLFSEIKIGFDNMWKDWWKGGSYFLVWFGTEFLLINTPSYAIFILTIFNFNFKIQVKLNGEAHGN